MITETFDSKTSAIINPDSFYGTREKLCDLCIVTFSNVVVENILKAFDCTQISAICTANGSIPIYKLTHQGKDICLLPVVNRLSRGGCLY